MDVANLLHSLTTQGLSLKLSEEPETIAVVGPVATLTLEQQRALSEHKQTLLSMLTPPPTCYIPLNNQADPDDLQPLKEAIEYFEQLADAVGTHNPERLDEIVLELEPQKSPCKRCGTHTTYLAILHVGDSLRRDCAKCGRFIDFPSWHNPEATEKILADLRGESRYNEKASSPSAGNTQATLTQSLYQAKEKRYG